MKNESLGTVFATRNYFKLGDESRSPVVKVELAKPRPAPDALDELEFVCPYRISSGGSTQVDSATGIDELHALFLALASINSKLYRLSKSLGFPLAWVGGEHGDLGIRIPDFVK